MMKRTPQIPLMLAGLLAIVFAMSAQATDKPIKAFICAGQSNMVGWGDSTKLPEELRKGNERVLMFEGGKWQPLRPHKPAFGGQRRVGLTEFHFGPEIAFGHEMAKAWPDETIGIIKFSIGGTSLLAEDQGIQQTTRRTTSSSSARKSDLYRMFRSEMMTPE